jgi:hypothetical protein
VPEGAIAEIPASNSTMYGWRPSFQVGEVLEGGAIGEVTASDDLDSSPAISSPPGSAGANGSTHLPQACSNSIPSGSRPRHSWELPECQG